MITKMKCHYFFYLFVLVFLVAGCSTVSEARKVQKVEVLPPGERTVKAAEIGLNKDTVLTIDKALEITLKYNPTVIQAQERLKSAQAQLKQAKSNYYPQASASSSYGKRTNNSVAGQESSKTSDSYSENLSASQLIYDFDKTPSAVRKAYYDAQASEYDLITAKSNLGFSVKETYYNVLRQESAVRLAEESLRQNEKYLEQAKGFFEVGTKIRYDITKAEVNVGNAQLSLISAKNALYLSRQTLNNVLGLAEDPSYQIEKFSGNITQTGISAVEIDKLLNLAKENNPEFKAQETRVKSASAGVDNAVASLWPSLSLSGSYSFGGSEFPLTWNRALSALLSFDIFNGGQKTAAIKSAVANLKSARASLSSLEQRLYLDISRAQNQMHDASEKLVVNNLILQQAQENLVLVEERYRIGKASSVELTDARITFTKLQENNIQSQFDYLIAKAALEKIVSGYNK
ncbi:MAG: TolC family protein [Planctomycetota bacterium]